MSPFKDSRLAPAGASLGHAQGIIVNVIAADRARLRAVRPAAWPTNEIEGRPIFLP